MNERDEYNRGLGMIEEIIISGIAGALIGCTFYNVWVDNKKIQLECENSHLRYKNSKLEYQLEYYENQEFHMLKELYKENILKVNEE